MKKISFTSLLLCLLLASLTLGQLGRVQIGATVAVYPHDVILVIVAGWLAVRQKITLPKMGTRNRVLGGLLGGVLLLGWLGAGMKGLEVWSPILRVSRLLGYAWIVTTFSRQVPRTLLTKWLSVFTIVGTALGILQYLVMPDMRWLAPLGWDDHYFRLLGTLLDPNYWGLWLVWVLLFWLERKEVPWLRWVMIIGSTFSLIATFSRASWLAAVIVLLLYFWRQSWRSYIPTLLLIGVIAVISWGVVPRPAGEGVHLTRTSSTVARVSSSLPWLALSPREVVMGRGLGVKPALDAAGHYAVVNHSAWPDNLEVVLISGLGVIGLAIGGAIGWTNRAYLKKLPREMVLLWVAAVVHAQFNASLQEPFLWLWVLLFTHYRLQLEYHR